METAFGERLSVHPQDIEPSCVIANFWSDFSVRDAPQGRFVSLLYCSPGMRSFLNDPPRLWTECIAGLLR
jgi:hypothetical protein